MGKTEMHEEFLRKKLIPVQKDHLRKQGYVEGRGYPEEAVPEILSIKDSFFGHIFPCYLEIHDKPADDKEEINPTPAEQK